MASSFCMEVMPKIKIISIIVNTLKILIPVIIVSVQIYRFIKAKNSKNANQVKKKKKGLVIGIIFSIIILFIPKIFVTMLDNDPTTIENPENRVILDCYENKLKKCLLNPFKCN